MPHHGTTTFQDSWLQQIDEQNFRIGLWCKKQSKSEAYCTLCCKGFSVSNSGIIQIKQHSKGEKHKAIATARFSMNLRRLGTVSNKSTTGNVSGSQSTDQNILLLNPTVTDQVTSAEILWLFKVSSSDFSFASCDDISKLFSRMFPCTISSNFSLSRAKASYVTSDGLGPFLLKSLKDELCMSSSAYTIMFDETTTSQCKRQMDILLRFWSEEQDEVVVRFLKALFFGHAFAIDISSSIMKILNDVELNFPVNRFFNLSSDGPNINKAVWKNMDTMLKNQNHPGLLPFVSCNMHVVHNAFKAGLTVYGSEAEEMAFDLHQWFKGSPCKREDFLKLEENTQLDNSLFYRHVPSRWCTLLPALEKVLEMWDLSRKYFIDFLPTNQSSKKFLGRNVRYKRLCEKLKSCNTMRAQIAFLVSVAPIFNKFLKKFQAEGPLVHILFAEAKGTLESVMLRFIKKKSIDGKTTKELLQLDVTEKDILLPLKSMEVGEQANKYLSKLGSSAETVRKQMQQFYISVAKHFQKRFPLDNGLLRDLACLHPVAQKKEWCVRAIGRIAKQMPHVINEGEIVLVRDEWKAYMGEDIPEEWYQIEVESEDGEIEIRYKRSDHYWRNIFKIKSPSGSRKYAVLTRLVKSCLSIHHGNAEVERSLSDNKNTVTPERTLLSEQAINGIRRAKDFARKAHGAHNIDITKPMILATRESHRAYQNRLQDQKEAKEMKEREKRIREEERERQVTRSKELEEKKKGLKLKENDMEEKEKVLSEEMESAETLLNEGNKRLSNAVSKKDFQEITVASALIDTAKSKMDKAKATLHLLQKDRKEINKRRGMLIEQLSTASTAKKAKK